MKIHPHPRKTHCKPKFSFRCSRPLKEKVPTPYLWEHRALEQNLPNWLIEKSSLSIYVYEPDIVTTVRGQHIHIPSQEIYHNGALLGCWSLWLAGSPNSWEMWKRVINNFLSPPNTSEYTISELAKNCRIPKNWRQQSSGCWILSNTLYVSWVKINYSCCNLARK